MRHKQVESSKQKARSDPILYVSGGDVNRERQAKGVHQKVSLAALDVFVGIVTVRPGSVRLECGCCVLRPWYEGDESSLVRHANNYEVWRHMRDQFPHPYTREAADEWIALVEQRNPQTYFAVEVHGEAVGGIGLILKSDVERCSAEIGYWLGEALWGKGIATVAVYLLRGPSEEASLCAREVVWSNITAKRGKAFSLTRIFAVPFANNPASMRVLEKAGYVWEGVMRRSTIKVRGSLQVLKFQYFFTV